jgi:hypothetical protein
MSSSLTLRSLVLFAVASVVSGFTWPNPRLEAFEALRWDQDGAHGGILGTGVSPCNQLPGRDEATNPGNETNAAQWLRTVGQILFFARIQLLTLSATAGVP